MAKKPDAPAAAKAPDASCRIVLLAGADAFVQTERVAALRQVLEKAHGEIDVLHFDGATASPAEVLDECRSFGLIARHKLIVVEQAELLVKDAARPLFERYAASPSDGTTLVFRSSRWYPGNLDKLIDAVGVRIACEPPDMRQALAWTVVRCRKRHRAEIEHDAAELLVERIGADLGRIDSELAKLAAAADDGSAPAGTLPRIKSTHVAQFVGRRREEEVWGIQNTLLFADAPAAVAHVRRLLDVSRQPGQIILWAMTDLARKVHGSSQANAQRLNPFHTSKVLKLWGASKDEILSAGAHLRPDAARALFSECVAADAGSKSGLAQADDVVERLALRFAGALSAGR